MKEYEIEKSLYEVNNALIDKIYKALRNIPDYKNLSLDRQGEIAMQIAKMIGN